MSHLQVINRAYEQAQARRRYLMYCLRNNHFVPNNLNTQK